MRYLLNHTQMQSCDSGTIEKMGVPSLVLMERAALAVREVIDEKYPDAVNVLVLCGSGNNGGDGFAVARLLNLAGRKASVLFLGKHASMTEQTQTQCRIFENYGGEILPDESAVKGYDLIVDALFGIGLSRDIIGRYADVIRAVNLSGTKVVAVDIPSGISADDGRVCGAAVHADTTVTFAFEKLGQVLYPGAAFCGELFVKDVGITDIGLDFTDSDREPAYTLQEEDLRSLLPKRRADANKGTYGKLLLVSGTVNMAGAARMAAESSLRCGCGLTCVLSHPENRTILQSGVPEAIFAPWNEDTEKRLGWADAIAIGPGLGTGEESLTILKTVLRGYTGPMVIDADALNLMAENPGLGPVNMIPAIITPHPGEMARLLNSGREDGAVSIADVTGDPVTCAREYARRTGFITVLKGARTVVTDGAEVFVNTAGNDGMATGGSGDVLTGIIGSLLAQGASPFDAARAGVLIHALAGDAAQEALGSRAMLAGDIIRSIHAVI